MEQTESPKTPEVAAATPPKKYDAFDEKTYVLAQGAEIDYTKMSDVKEYYKIATAGWKTLCYEDNNGQCCFLLGTYHSDIGHAYYTNEYNPEKGFKIMNEACERLTNAGCCQAVAQNYIQNSSKFKNWAKDAQEPLYFLEAKRRACLEQTEESTGGPRPSDLHDKLSAGEACNHLFEFVDHFRNANEQNFRDLKVNHLGGMFDWVRDWQLKSPEQLTNHLKTQINPENPLKPNISAIVNMLHHVQPGVFIEQACLFKDAESCHKLFHGKIKGLYGLKRDPVGAVDACEEACRRNVVKACYNAYKIHSKGLYVPPDQNKANHYFNLYNELIRPVSKDNFEDDSERDADRVAR